MKICRLVSLSMLSLLTVVPTACETTYSPSFTSVDVSCTPSTDVSVGAWTFSSWVVDGDGADDIESVTVTLLDLQEQPVDRLALQQVDEAYWVGTKTGEELGIDCADRHLYLYRFQVTDRSGQTTTRDLTL